MVLSGRGRHLGTDVAWQLRCRPDGAFLEEIRGEHLSFSWGHPGGSASCWEVRGPTCALLRAPLVQLGPPRRLSQLLGGAGPYHCPALWVPGRLTQASERCLFLQTVSDTATVSAGSVSEGSLLATDPGQTHFV